MVCEKGRNRLCDAVANTRPPSHDSITLGQRPGVDWLSGETMSMADDVFGGTGRVVEPFAAEGLDAGGQAAPESAGTVGRLEAICAQISALRSRPVELVVLGGVPRPLWLALDDRDIIACPELNQDARAAEVLELVGGMLNPGAARIRDILPDLRERVAVPMDSEGLAQLSQGLEIR